MRTRAIIEGLSILEQYRDESDGSNTGAEHDAIYAFSTDSPVAKEDLERLIALGWFQEFVETGEEDFSVEYYSEEESWCCYP